MLTVHHLGRSQSERIVWLCEELQIPYELKRYDRLPTGAGPPEYKALHPQGSAPIITDGPFAMAESGAITDYIIETYGGGRLKPKPSDPGYADYLYWFHFANGTLTPAFVAVMFQGPPQDPPTPGQLQTTQRFGAMLGMLETRLGEAPYLGGDDLTAADTMTVFILTTARGFAPISLEAFPNIRAYLQRVGARPAYQSAMRKSEPDMEPLLT
jgi:glutathione S-transferase